MSLVNEKSPVTAIPELDFYTKAPVQTSIESTYSEEIRPIAQLNTGGHIEFNIHNGHNEYIRLKETTLYIKFRVKLSKTDNTPIVALDWNKVSIVNNFLHSLWSQIDLTIGDSQTTSSIQTYPYRAYFETLLGSTEQGRLTFLHASGYSKDDMSNSGNMVNTNRQSRINHKASEGELSTGRICEMEGKLHLDLFFQPRLMIGGTKIKVKLVPNRPEFYFMTAANSKLSPRIEFLDVHLNIMKSRISDEIQIAQIQAMNISPVKYIINRSEVRTVTIDRNATNRSIENVVNGQLPRRVYIAFTSNDAYGGNFEKNPYVFHHYHINSIACFLNGQQFPSKAYTPDFDNDLYMREYLELFRASEQFDNDARMPITFSEYKHSYTIFAFNLSQDLSQGYNSAGYVNIPKEGVLRFEIRFNQALDTTINALIFCEFDNQISIAEDRNAFMDYR